METRFGKDKITVNTLDCATEKELELVSSSTEFELGTLAIILVDPAQQMARLRNIYECLQLDIETQLVLPPFTFVFCERDGYICYLVHTKITDFDILALKTVL